MTIYIPYNLLLLLISHPLVLLNISDHYTRLKLQDPTIAEKGLYLISCYINVYS